MEEGTMEQQDDLRVALGMCAAARKDVADCEAALKEALEELAQTPLYQATQAAHEILKVLKAWKSEMESSVKRLARARYDADQDKHPIKGVNIKINHRLVYDAKIAQDWCKQNAPFTFKWDAKSFEEAAAKMDGAPVTIEDDPQATLASDLSDYLSA